MFRDQSNGERQLQDSRKHVRQVRLKNATFFIGLHSGDVAGRINRATVQQDTKLIQMEKVR
jgi:hypothetical protein